MWILGLTGQSGAGKGYIASLFSKRNAWVIDCDAVARATCAPNTPCTIELAKNFGENILNFEGSLNRKVLAKIVFSSPEKLKLLNQITHPHIAQSVLTQVDFYDKQGVKVVLLDAPTLIESGLHNKCNYIIAVTAPFQVRLERICLRDHLNEEDAKMRLLAQPALDFYLKHAHFVIENDGVRDCQGQVDCFLNTFFDF